MQSETFDIRDVPGHFVPISKFGCQAKGRDATDEYKAVKRAYVAEQIDGIKFKRGKRDVRGQIFVDPEQAARAIADAATRPVRRSSPPANWPSPESVLNRRIELAAESIQSIDKTLDEIYRVLERLATTVENIATQPKAEPVGTWRDMNGEVMN